MQLLEAQVEPHFLYNTLAHVVSLVDADPPLAKRMLHRLIELLRATAAAAQDGSHARARGSISCAPTSTSSRMRMGPRLAWSIDVPPDLAAVEIPPMLLQPVVENAIKHGLEPKIDGGRVDVARAARGRKARADGGRHGRRHRGHARSRTRPASAFPTCARGCRRCSAPMRALAARRPRAVGHRSDHRDPAAT